MTRGIYALVEYSDLVHSWQVTNKKENPDQEFTMLESLCEMGQSPSTEGAADGGVENTVAREGGLL